MLEKGLNSPAFHAGIHGFESRTCHSSRAFSSAGRASALQAECRRFDPVNAHSFYSGAVVQIVRMPACHAGGRGFDSHLRRSLICRCSSIGRAADL